MTIKMLKQFFCSSSIQSCAILILRTAVTYLKADLLFHEMRFAIKDFKEKEISDSLFFFRVLINLATKSHTIDLYTILILSNNQLVLQGNLEDQWLRKTSCAQ